MSGAQRLRAYLDRTKQNQAEFARESGFSEPFVSQLLTETRRPSITNAVRLEHLTGIPVAAWAETDDA